MASRRDLQRLVRKQMATNALRNWEQQPGAMDAKQTFDRLRAHETVRCVELLKKAGFVTLADEWFLEVGRPDKEWGSSRYVHWDYLTNTEAAEAHRFIEAVKKRLKAEWVKRQAVGKQLLLRLAFAKPAEMPKLVDEVRKYLEGGQP